MSIPGLTHSIRPVKNPPISEFNRYALQFPGAPYISCGVDIFTQATFVNGGTVELMVYFTNLAGNQRLFSIEGRMLLFWKTLPPGNTLRFEIYDGAAKRVNGPAAVANEWYYMCGVWDTVNMYSYVNQVQRGPTASGVGIIDLVNRDTTIGIEFDGITWPSYSIIPFVRVYDRPLTLAERYNNMMNYKTPVEDGLILWYDLEEGRGTTAYDKGTGGNNGTLLPAPNLPDWVNIEKGELRSRIGL